MTTAGRIEPEASALALGAAHICEMREARARLAGERSRIVALVEAAQAYDEGLAELRSARSNALAAALVDGGEADVTALDSRIIEAEATAARALAAGETAQNALQVIEARRAAIADELVKAIDAQLSLADDDLRAQRDAAYCAYNNAVEALREPLQLLLAIENALGGVRDRLTHGSLRGGHVGIAHHLAAALRDKGLRVLREHDYAISTPAWLGWPEITAASRVFSQSYFRDAALD